MASPNELQLKQAYADHSRRWHDLSYCYPVVSRRSGGLSLGINLNPDKACNFDCIYCQVDRAVEPTVRKVDLAVVRSELERLVDAALDGSIFAEPPFDALPVENRVIRDIAFSGDGEPTTYPDFEKAVRLAAELKQARGLNRVKIVLITDACYLTRPNVAAGLRVMDENNGEIWAKLDAGTQEYYEAVNRPNYPLSHVLSNIRAAANERPIVIQSLWMRVKGEPPPDEEVRAFCDRLNEIIAEGGRIKLVQVYTIARRTAEPYATPLSRTELERITDVVRANVAAPIEAYPGIST
jgi:wyosine [tRNA(Phe)-imidazoG37] synthetase (radical SAM superfamily)